MPKFTSVCGRTSSTSLSSVTELVIFSRRFVQFKTCYGPQKVVINSLFSFIL